MGRFACKLLLFLAVLLMPLGMSVPAAAEAHAAAAADMSHCRDQAPEQSRSSAVDQCTMGCSAALPAVDLPVLLVAAPNRTLLEPTAVGRLRGIQIGTATPPPRSA
jgi:hypothetical protein